MQQSPAQSSRVLSKHLSNSSRLRLATADQESSTTRRRSVLNDSLSQFRFLPQTNDPNLAPQRQSFEGKANLTPIRPRDAHTRVLSSKNIPLAKELLIRNAEELESHQQLKRIVLNRAIQARKDFGNLKQSQYYNSSNPNSNTISYSSGTNTNNNNNNNNTSMIHNDNNNINNTSINNTSMILTEYDLRKQRILNERKLEKSHLAEQKEALSYYLKSGEVSESVIQNHKEMIHRTSPAVAAARYRKQERKAALKAGIPLAAPTLNKSQSIDGNVAISTYYVSQHRGWQLKGRSSSNEQIPTANTSMISLSTGTPGGSMNLKQPITVQQQTPQIKSGLAYLVDAKNLKPKQMIKQTSKEDPTKFRMRKFFERFLKGEEAYFTGLEKQRREGQKSFERGIGVQQKFFYGQIRDSPAESTFNTNVDLKTNKYLCLLHDQKEKHKQESFSIQNNKNDSIDSS